MQKIAWFDALLAVYCQYNRGTSESLLTKLQEATTNFVAKHLRLENTRLKILGDILYFRRCIHAVCLSNDELEVQDIIRLDEVIDEAILEIEVQLSNRIEKDSRLGIGGIGVNFEEFSPGSQAAYEQVAVGIAQVKLDGHFYFTNQSYCQMLGYTAQELGQMSVREVTHPEDWFTVQDQQEQLMRREIAWYRTEKRYIRKDGTIFWGQIIASLQRDQNQDPQYTLAVLIDISDRKKIEEQLLTDRAHLAAILDQLPLGVAIMQAPTGKMIDYNQMAAELAFYSGLPINSIDDYSHFRSMHPDGSFYQPMEYPIARALFGEVVKNHELYMLRDDGTRTELTVNAGPIRNEQGEIIAGACIFWDTSERKQGELERLDLMRQLEEQKAFLEEVFRISPAGIVLAEAPTGRILRCSLEAKQLLEISETVDSFQDYQKTEQWYLNGERLKVENYPLVRSMKNGELIFNEEFSLDRSDGQILYLMVSSAPVYDKNKQIVASISVFHNTTNQKELEQQLRQAKESAEEASKAKSAFLANMSHEIRTPLAAILGASEILSRPDLQEKVRSNFTGIMNRNANALVHLIDDILDLSKVEAGHLAIEKRSLHLADFITDVIGSLSFNAEEKGIKLTVEWEEAVPKVILTDQNRLRQILLNVIGNAVKFTDQGSILIQVKCLSDQASRTHQLAFFVKDTGCGIAADKVKDLFQAFSQVDHSTTRNHGGSGLGLALSRRLAEILGGDVTLLESIPNIGSTFIVTIDISPNVVAKQPPSIASGQAIADFDLTNYRVLVVDDMLDNQMLIEKMLSYAGAKVEIANNGAEAVEKGLSSAYDLILMDVQMPVLDGYQATRELRRLGFRKPIVALTAHALLDERRKSMEIGCSGHLAKPITKDQLIAAVSFYLKMASKDG